MKKRNSIYSYLLCALFAALTAICGQIMVPLPFTPVPISLALLAVLVCGGVLGAKKGAVAMLVYILLGAVGAPVFAGLTGGLGIIAGPTGGYIIGYLPAAVVMGLLAARGSERAAKAGEAGGAAGAARGLKTTKSLGLTIAMGVPAVAVCYALGTAWFVISTGTGFAASLMMCVIPFIPGDVLKIIAAAAVCEALRRPMRSFARA
ncbi:MAG: biotin transporter BioY [Clostridiales Family XIII bacterium]|jgi:biotin transport system substrate-specific component|nr:biotin transporter BioY [Clostridiales Family XIII bacterium]